MPFGISFGVYFGTQAGMEVPSVPFLLYFYSEVNIWDMFGTNLLGVWGHVWDVVVLGVFIMFWRENKSVLMYFRNLLTNSNNL